MLAKIPLALLSETESAIVADASGVPSLEWDIAIVTKNTRVNT